MYSSQDVPPPGFYPPPSGGAPFPPPGNYGHGGAPYPPQNPEYPPGPEKHGQGGAPYPTQNPGYQTGDGAYGQGTAPYPTQNPGYPPGPGNYGQGAAPYPTQNPGYPPGTGDYGQGAAPYPTQNPGYPPASYPAGNENFGQGPPPSTFTPPPGGIYNRNYEDNDEAKGFGFNDKSIRRGFITKVYSIVFCQVLLTFLIVLPFVFKESKLHQFARKNILLGLASSIVALVLLIFLMCVESIRRKSPMNYIFLFTFTIFEGIAIGFIGTKYEPTVIAISFGITAVICFALTCFAFQTKWDFTGMGPYLFVAGLVLFLFSIIGMFFAQGSIFKLILAGFGVTLMSFYLIYDTQMMIGGNKKYSISPEEYVFAAVNIYTDIITIFLYVLELVNECSD